MGRGNYKSARGFNKALKGAVGSTNKNKANLISGHLEGKIFESSGLSKKEALDGINKLKAEGKLSWQDVDRLKKRL